MSKTRHEQKHLGRAREELQREVELKMRVNENQRMIVIEILQMVEDLDQAQADQQALETRSDLEEEG